MTSIETASALYEDVVDGNEQSSSALAAALENKAREVREAGTQRVSDDVRDELQRALETATPADAEAEIQEVADHLEEAARDVRSSIEGAVTMKELPDGVAGQAELGTSNVWIDHDSIRANDGDRLIDTDVARDIAVHEQEHTRQSQASDQEGITVDGKSFDSREVREAAAISVQRHTDFLSSEYRRITAALPMNETDRALVRAGNFSELERQKNGSEPLVATAA